MRCQMKLSVRSRLAVVRLIPPSRCLRDPEDHHRRPLHLPSWFCPRRLSPSPHEHTTAAPHPHRPDTHPLLGQLPGLLVLGVPQQFHDSLLVRRETGDLPNDVLDEELLLTVDTIRERSVCAQANRCTSATHVWTPFRLEGRAFRAMTVVGRPLLEPYRRSTEKSTVISGAIILSVLPVRTASGSLVGHLNVGHFC